MDILIYEECIFRFVESFQKRVIIKKLFRKILIAEDVLRVT